MSNFRFPDHTFIIAEAGINHNGSLEMALQLIDAAAEAGADAVKFQKRTPHMSLPPELWNQERETPWGVRMTYLEYRQKIELGPRDYLAIVEHCRKRNILFSASPWDCNAANTLYGLEVPFVKIASASVTNLELVAHVSRMQRPVVMSTGMCTLDEIKAAVKVMTLAGVPQIGLLVCTSTYPAKVEDLNLSRIYTLQEEFSGLRIGYSGHEVGLYTTLCAVAMGARIVERHITLDRALPGSDQAASIEPAGFKRLVRDIRNFEKAFGDASIRVLDCEKPSIQRLRGSTNATTGSTQEGPDKRDPYREVGMDQPAFKVVH